MPFSGTQVKSSQYRFINRVGVILQRKANGLLSAAGKYHRKAVYISDSSTDFHLVRRPVELCLVSRRRFYPYSRTGRYQTTCIFINPPQISVDRSYASCITTFLKFSVDSCAVKFVWAAPPFQYLIPVGINLGRITRSVIVRFLRFSQKFSDRVP